LDAKEATKLEFFRSIEKDEADEEEEEDFLGP
jgi:hypothetical protein